MAQPDAEARRRRADAGRRGRAAGYAALLLAVALVAGVVTAVVTRGGSDGTTKPTVATPRTPAQSAGPVQAGPQGGKPAIPRGAYLGASVNPGGRQFQDTAAKEHQVAPFEAAIGRPLGISHHYYKWTAPFPTAVEARDVARGSIPMISWACGAKDVDVAAGREDAVITAHADAVKRFGHPVFLRWFWEMNLKDKHRDCIENGTDYVAAWQHIWKIFHDRGVSNAAWVWCPGSGAFPDADSQYFPGGDYVDWIAADGYSRGNRQRSFGAFFRAFYDKWSRRGKPLMIAETGAKTPPNQVAWLTSASTAMTTMPDLKALVYWDSPDYVLTGDGLTTFRKLATEPYFRS